MRNIATKSQFSFGIVKEKKTLAPYLGIQGLLAKLTLSQVDQLKQKTPSVSTDSIVKRNQAGRKIKVRKYFSGKTKPNLFFLFLFFGVIIGLMSQNIKMLQNLNGYIFQTRTGSNESLI